MHNEIKFIMLYKVSNIQTIIIDENIWIYIKSNKNCINTFLNFNL